jgi:outer membrane protein TolC
VRGVQKISVLTLLALSGCAHYQAQPIALADVVRTQAQHSLTAPCCAALHVGTAWREAELVAAALCFNPALARATAAVRLAALNGELAGRYPGLALIISAEYAPHAPETSKWLRAFSIEVPLDFGARKALRLDGARLNAMLSGVELALAQRQVAAQIGLSVLALRAALAEQRLLLRREMLWHDWLKFTDQRIAEGQAVRTERLNAQHELLNVQAAVHQAQSAERDARGQLAQGLGVPLAQVLSLALAPPDAAALSIAPIAEALPARGELLRALGQYQLAELALRLEIAKQWPELRLAPGYSWERGLVKLPLALSAMLPPLDGNRAAIAVALAARTLAARELELVQANITADIDLARTRRDATHVALALAREQLTLGKIAVDAAQAAFNLGELDQLGRLSSMLQVNELSLTVQRLDAELAVNERMLATALGVAPTGAKPTLSSND